MTHLTENKLLRLPSDMHVGAAETLKELHLGYNLITTLTDSTVFKLNQLLLLDLQHNQLSEVPVMITSLVTLEYLDLRNNSLKQIPPEIGLMPALKKIFLEGNMLKGMPSELYTKGSLAILNHLKKRVTSNEVQPASTSATQFIPMNGTVNITDSKLKEIPMEIFAQPLLKRLCAASNQIATIPPTIQNAAQSLIQLDLSKNKISLIPIELAQCSHLEELNLSHNLLVDITPLLTLSRLTTLDVSTNRISVIPADLFTLPNLSVLHVSYPHTLTRTLTHYTKPNQLST